MTKSLFKKLLFLCCIFSIFLLPEFQTVAQTLKGGETNINSPYCPPDTIELEETVVFLSCPNNPNYVTENCGKSIIGIKLHYILPKHTTFRFVISSGKLFYKNKELFWDLGNSQKGVQTITVKFYKGKKLIEKSTKTLTVKLCENCR